MSNWKIIGVASKQLIIDSFFMYQIKGRDKQDVSCRSIIYKTSLAGAILKFPHWCKTKKSFTRKLVGSSGGEGHDASRFGFMLCVGRSL
jgi:hypothetical protein